MLLSGFSTLLTSSFGGTFYIGLLLAACLASAMVLELTLSPILILLFYPRAGRKQPAEASAKVKR